MNGVIYGILDMDYPERIRYVGQTTRFTSRRTEHWRAAQQNKKLPVSKYLRKHLNRKNRIEFRVLDTALDHDILDELEIKWISDLRSRGQADLNVTGGGRGSFRVEWAQDRRDLYRERMLAEWSQNPSRRNRFKMSYEAAREMRTMASREWVSREWLRKEFKCSLATVRSILLNLSWKDPNYDPRNLKNRPVMVQEQPTTLTADIVRQIRRDRLEGWVSNSELGKKYGITPSHVSNIIRNLKWVDPEYDPTAVPLAGSDGHGSKLTRGRAEEIRAKHVDGRTQLSLALEYGLSAASINRIVKGRSWR